jgi:nitroimidazol reductase NimA-like FMN-containing flavoprotein (pyridoxamine 5'-phosphate oxidase superfamily)
MDVMTREEIDGFLDQQALGRMGCHHAGTTYIVPLIYARDGDALYIFATEGQKTRFARENPSVCFELDEHEPATRAWRSVIVQGRYEELDEAGAAAAREAFSRRFGARTRGGSEEKASGPPGVTFRIRIEDVTGRAVRARVSPGG